MMPHVQVLAADQRVPGAPAGGPPRPRPRPQAGHGHQVRHPGQAEDRQRSPGQRWESACRESFHGGLNWIRWFYCFDWLNILHTTLGTKTLPDLVFCKSCLIMVLTYWIIYFVFDESFNLIPHGPAWAWLHRVKLQLCTLFHSTFNIQFINFDVHKFREKIITLSIF